MTTITAPAGVGAVDPSGPEYRRARRRARRRQGLREGLSGWAFVLPGTIIVLGLSIFPAIWSFILSLQSWDGFSDPTFVGGANFSELVTDSEFRDAVAHTGLYTLLFVPASVLAGLFLAVALNRRIRLIGFYRTAIFVPFVASAAATGILSTYLFDPQYGLINNVLRTLHLPTPGWLQDQSQAMIVIAIMSLWGQAAFTTVIYLAGLQDVPAELLEAARLDGANRWQTFWRIVWPHLTPITVFTVVWQTIQAVQLFDLVYVTTKGGPLDATTTIVLYLYKKAFVATDFGVGSAAAWVLFALTLLITIGVVVYSRRRGLEAI
jgi:multiple sugar transport system permease protein